VRRKRRNGRALLNGKDSCAAAIPQPKGLSAASPLCTKLPSPFSRPLLCLGCSLYPFTPTTEEADGRHQEGQRRGNLSLCFTSSVHTISGTANGTL
jgi:hypothetical protein